MKSFVCEGCPKEFARRDVLLNHKRGQYGGEEKVKENVCSTCGKEFSKKANLIIFLNRNSFWQKLHMKPTLQKIVSYKDGVARNRPL